MRNCTTCGGDFNQAFTRIKSEGMADLYIANDRYGIPPVSDGGSIATDLHSSGTTWDGKLYSVDVEVDNNRATIYWDAPLTYRWWFAEWAFSHLALNYSLMDGKLFSQQTLVRTIQTYQVAQILTAFTAILPTP